MSLLQPQAEGIPLPTVTEVSQPFWDGCARGELLVPALAVRPHHLDPGGDVPLVRVRRVHVGTRRGQG